MPANKQSTRVAGFRLAEFLPYRLAVATDGMARVFAENYQNRFKLTIPEWRVLAVIEEYGTLSPTVIGQRTAMDKVKVSRAAQSLVARGLLRQSHDPHDGRGRLLRLTRKGQATHAGMVPLATRLESALFDDLSRAELAALGRVLSKITTRFETADRGGTGAGSAQRDAQGRPGFHPVSNCR